MHAAPFASLCRSNIGITANGCGDASASPFLVALLRSIPYLVPLQTGDKMTNVSGSAEKVQLRKWLSRFAVDSLQKEGWKVEKVPKFGKSSVRRISRNGEKK